MASTVEGAAAADSDRYRTIPETSIVKMLMFLGWPYDFASGVAEKESRKLLETRIKLGLAYRHAASGERLFDYAEVLNFSQNKGADSRERTLSEQRTDTNRRKVLDFLRIKSPRDWPSEERRFEVDFKRTYNLRAIAPGSKLRLRAPLPLTGEHLLDLKVVPFADTDRENNLSVSPGRLELGMMASGEKEITFGAMLSFTAKAQSPSPNCPSIDNSDKAIYLSKREGLIVVSERISELVRSLVLPTASAVEAIRAFWEFIYGKLIRTTLHYDQINLASPCDWTLDRGCYDCQTGAALFVALCRAQGIPARIVTGYLLHPLAPAKHYWADAWIDDRGWSPFDFFVLDSSQHETDREWRDLFFGRLEYRMTCEHLPMEFTGALGVPVPRVWLHFEVPGKEGLESSLLNIDGTPVYTDTIRVRM